MTSIFQEQEIRRVNIIDGINKGFTYSNIAAKLGVNLWIVMGDLKRMRYNSDPELKQAYRKAEERVQAKKQSVASLSDETFHRVTGMTFKEKTFRNMMSFYKPELMKILKSKDERAEIRDLPKSVRRTLKRHGILVLVRNIQEISVLARAYLLHKPSVNS